MRGFPYHARPMKTSQSSHPWRRRAAIVALALAAFLVTAGGGVVWWVQQPLVLSADKVIFYLPAGTGVHAAAEKIVEAGVHTQPLALEAYLRLSARGQAIQAGEYEVKQGVKLRRLLTKLVRGERLLRRVTLVEGWTFAQVRAALAKAPYLKQDAADLSDADLMAALGHPGMNPEGRFFPDTYQYTRDSSELELLRHAMQLMDKRLQAAWDERTPGLPLRSLEDALILASIVEKETGLAKDRANVAGVFINRLKKGMPLQTDPTVIYGLGSAYDGRLTRADLQMDTPFNTYLHRGLPPTPIAMPGEASLLAAVRPEATSALYFVARGDGSSHFSETLDEHNRAVNKYLRNTP